MAFNENCGIFRLLKRNELRVTQMTATSDLDVATIRERV